MKIFGLAVLTFLPSALLSAAMPAFQPNKGQVDRAVRYITHLEGGAVFFTDSQVVIQGRKGDVRLS